MKSLKKVSNTLRTKVIKYCSFVNKDQLKFMTNSLKDNLIICLTNKKPLRLFQMDKMVLRSEDGSIMMNVTVPTNEKHHVFNKAMCEKYLYYCKKENQGYYVYSLFEAICYQIGFFTWDDIRKSITLFFYIYFNTALLFFRTSWFR